LIDFDALVLSPLMGTFGQPVTVTPLASQPGQPVYVMRGVPKVENIDVQLEDGIVSMQVITMGVRVRDFDVFVKPGDLIAWPGFDTILDDTDEDAQGGSKLTLKKRSE
jgi:hypothetical protein